MRRVGALVLLAAGTVGCRGARFALPQSCPLQEAPISGMPTLDVATVVPFRIRIHRAPAAPARVLRLRGLLRQEPEFTAVADRMGPSLDVHYARIHENDVLTWETARACRGRRIVIEGEYREVPLAGEAFIEPRHVWLAR